MSNYADVPERRYESGFQGWPRPGFVVVPRLLSPISVASARDTENSKGIPTGSCCAVLFLRVHHQVFECNQRSSGSSLLDGLFSDVLNLIIIITINSLNAPFRSRGVSSVEV